MEINLTRKTITRDTREKIHKFVNYTSKLIPALYNTMTRWDFFFSFYEEGHC